MKDAKRPHERINKFVRILIFALSVGFMILASIALASGMEAQSGTRILGAIFFGVVGVWLASIYPMVRDALR